MSGYRWAARACAACVLLSTITVQADPCNWRAYRLPTTTVPSRYDLDMTVDPDASTVSGSVQITAEQAVASKCIVMHAGVAMSVGPVTVTASDGKVYTGVTSRYDPSEDPALGASGSEGPPPEDLTGQLTITFESDLPAGQVTLATAFNYTLAGPGVLDGFHINTATNAEGVVKTLAATYMASSLARDVLPCFDEPAYKAVFKASMTSAAANQVLFNTAEEASTTLDSGLVKHTFELTPVMDTQSLGFVVGELFCIEGPYTRANGETVTVRMHHPNSDALARLTQPLAIAIASLGAMEKLFTIPYPLSKLDVAVLPTREGGGSAGFGLLSYDSYRFEISNVPEETGIDDLTPAVTELNRGISYMWFGGLVHATFWNDWWISTAFSSYFQLVGANAYWNEGPETTLGRYDRLKVFYGARAQGVLRVNLRGSSPLSIRADSIVSASDAAPFSLSKGRKGAAVLRTLRSYLARDKLTTLLDTAIDTDLYLRRLMASEAPRKLLAVAGGTGTEDFEQQNDVFIQGLNAYLEEYKYSTSTADELLESLEKSTGLPIPVWMDAWVYQGGVPLITVAIGEDGTLLLSQERFTGDSESDPMSCDFDKNTLIKDTKVAMGSEDPSAPPAPMQDVPWWIPVAYSVGGSSAVEWTTMHACNLTLDVDVGDNYVKLNVGQYGLYRVNYSTELWARLVAAASISDINDPNYIPDSDLEGLMEDASDLGEAGLVSITVFLDFTAALAARASGAETGDMPVRAAERRLYTLYDVIEEGECRQNLRDYAALDIVTAILDTRGITLVDIAPGDTARDRTLRLLLGSMAVRYDTPAIRASAEAAIIEESKGGKLVPPGNRENIYQIGARTGNDAVLAWFNFISTTYEESPQFYNAGRGSMAPNADLEALTKAWEYQLTSVFETFEVPDAFRLASLTPFSRDATLQWLIANGDRLQASIDADDETRFFTYVDALVLVAEQYNDVETAAPALAYFDVLFPEGPIAASIQDYVRSRIARKDYVVEVLQPVVCEWAAMQRAAPGDPVVMPPGTDTLRPRRERPMRLSVPRDARAMREKMERMVRQERRKAERAARETRSAGAKAPPSAPSANSRARRPRAN